MNTFMDTQKNALLRKYHALLRKAGISNDEKMALLASYGVESGKDMTVYELTELCYKLDMQTNRSAQEVEKWRRRVMGAIGGYLRAMGRTSNVNLIQAIACRAARYERFNAIPIDQLRSLYNAFKKRTRALEAVDDLTMELNAQSYLEPLGEA